MNRRIRFRLLVLSTLLPIVVSTACSAQEYRVQSPQGTLEVLFAMRDGAPTYSLFRHGKELVRESRLGIALAEGPSFDKDLEIVSTHRKSHHEVWTQPWGEKREILCSCCELRINLKQRVPQAREMAVVFRVFDDGIGFRYEWPEQSNLSSLMVSDELTEFNLAEDCSTWWIADAGQLRFMPIMMTTLTTIGGLLSLMFAGGPLFEGLATVTCNVAR